MHAPCTALSWHSHCADGVLKTQWHSKGRRTNSVQKQRTAIAFVQQHLYAPAELLLRYRRPYCVTMVTLRRPHYALIRTPSDGVCFEHAQSARSRFLRTHSVYWRCHCVAAVVLAIVLRAPRRSAFFLDAVGSP